MNISPLSAYFGDLVHFLGLGVKVTLPRPTKLYWSTTDLATRTVTLDNVEYRIEPRRRVRE